MRIRLPVIAVTVILFLAAPVLAASFNGKKTSTGTWMGQEIEYVQGEILFKAKSGFKVSDVERLFAESKAQMVEGPDRLGMGKLEVSLSTNMFQVIRNLQACSLIEFAEPNMIDRALYPPNDYYFANGYQWWLDNCGEPPGCLLGADINAPNAWDITAGNSDVLIAILDSGIPMLQGFPIHPDLSNSSRYIPGEDFTGDGELVRDNYGHGTHVIGIIAARTNNSTGVAGVDWNCNILIDQVFDSLGVGTHNTFKNGVLHAVDYGARVINYSGGGSHSLTKEQAVSYADSQNVLLVASAGNGYGDSVLYPAHYSEGYQNVMAVSATTCEERLAGYSNLGPQISVAAPGGGGLPWNEDDVFSTTPPYTVTLNGSPYYLTESYGYVAGTSMACGMVTGLAALLLSVDLSFSAYELKEIIEQSADEVGDYQYYIETGKCYELGHGVINCYEALVLASGYTYVYGDANGDEEVTVEDLIYLLNYLFRDGLVPDPASSGDANADCEITMGDVLYILNYLYRLGPTPKRGCVEE